MQKILIIGNGPSLRGLDFHSLTVDTLGMNAAYRHWERIDWYPTWYSCLDDQLMITHHRRIKEMVVEGKVKGALLHGSFFEFHPECVNDSRFYILGQFVESQYQKTAKPLGLPFLESVAFDTSNQTKITTGSHSVRFAAFLGYSEIGIVGVDLKYTEIIPEATVAGDVALKIKKTPKKNPNYFFDDYQQKGDRYNIPNPDVHDGTLHLDAFRLIPADFQDNGLPVRVVNCNPSSGLADHDILPFQELEHFMRPALGAVVVPCNEREEAQLLTNLRLWASRRLAPFLSEPRVKPTLVFSFNNDSGEATARRLKEVFFECSLDRFFDRVEFLFLGLQGDMDVYQRSYDKPSGKMGFKAGPNNQFFRTMRSCQHYGRAIFLMESDCIPIRPNWLGHLLETVSSSAPFLVMGSALRGQSVINGEFARHINGNAMYATGTDLFQRFIDEVWEPKLWQAIETSDRRLAYDCFIERHFSAMDSLAQDDEAWNLWKKTAHLFRFSNAVQNHSGKIDTDSPDSELVRRILREDPDTYLVHSQPVASAALEQYLRDGYVEPRDWSVGATGVPPSQVASGNIGKASKQVAVKSSSKEKSAYPRLLMIDSTPLGSASATGQLKAKFLGDWPEDRFLQIWEQRAGSCSLRTLQLCDTGTSSSEDLSEDELLERCIAFDPDVIYFRPVEYPLITGFAERAVNELGAPLVLHIMDDWQSRMREEDPAQFEVMDAALRRFLARSSKCLSICVAMSKEYERRYGQSFTALANGVDMAHYPAKSWSARGKVSKSHPFVIRYMGALADDMTFASVCEVAEAVVDAQSRVPVTFEIYTMDWCQDKAEERLGDLPGISIKRSVSADSYPGCLQGADALLIAYNFDQTSVRYVKLSMANKMPECLATGVPVLAYGPGEVATIDYLQDSGVAVVVSECDRRALVDAIISLAGDLDACRVIGERARQFVGRNHTLESVQSRFLASIREAIDSSTEANETLRVGPYPRAAKAHFDETEAVASYFRERQEGDVMIDVGAHHGGALTPFLDMGWKVYAFEPDNNNRAILEKRIAAHVHGKNVILDSRAVGESIQAGIDFFTSPESHGISGLSAFHESHSVAQQVEVTTLRHAIDFGALSQVDFLKIDTEGHDLFVLRGFPWEKMQPSVIECEFEDAKTKPLGYDFDDIAGFLVEKGYRVYVSEWHPVRRYGIRHDWHRLVAYPCELAPRAWGNLLAFRDCPKEAAIAGAVRELLEFAGTLPSSESTRSPASAGRNQVDRFGQANRLWREGRYEQARALYLELYEDVPLELYRDNAAILERKIEYLAGRNPAS